MSLNPDDLHVESFATADPYSTGGRCCTGCVSGCGINPTAGGCESQPDTFGAYTCDCNTTVVAAE
ncbi:MAG TPA: hypothetical protein VF746_03810 [Longimicrobium sp.]|jgi:hypothetical protein